MFNFNKFNEEFKQIVNGLNTNGYVNIIEQFSTSDNLLTIKIGLNDQILDLVVKYLEVNLFLPAYSQGFVVRHYRRGPIKNAPGQAVLELEIGKQK